MMRDATVAAIWYGINVAMLVGLWRLVRSWWPGDTVPQSLLHLVVLTCGIVVLLSLLLGAVGLLSLIGLGAGCAAVAAATLRLAKRSPMKMGQAPNLLFGASPIFMADAKPWERKLWFWVWTGIASVLAGIVVMRGVLEFPNDWDSLMYHIPLIDLWLQTGSLYVPQNPAWSNPGNAELLGLWIVAPFSGDFWIGLANVPVALLVILGMVELGRQLGLTWSISQLCALVLVASGVFLKQIRTTENDLAVLGFFVAALAYGIRHVRSDRLGDLLLAGACLGLLAGVKYYALGYTAVAWAAVVLLSLRHGGWTKALQVAAVGIASIALLAGYWYARNYLASGTPFFPFGFTDRTDVLAQLRPGTWQSTLLGNGRWELLPEVVTAMWNEAGLCQVAALLLLPVTVAHALGSRWLVRKPEPTGTLMPELRWLLLFLLLGTMAVFSVTPFVVDPDSPLQLARGYRAARFGLCFEAVAVLALGLLASDASRWAASWTLGGSRVAGLLRLAPGAVFAGLVVAQCVMVARTIRGDDWPEIVLVGIDICILAVIVARISLRVNPWSRAMALAAGALATAGLTLWQANWCHAGFAQHFDRMFHQSVFSQLEKLAPPRPHIAVLGYRSYGFFGSRRQFRVFRPQRVLSRDALYGYLGRHGIGIVAAVRQDLQPFPNYQDVDTWLQESPKTFERIDVGGRFNVYRVRAAGALAGDAASQGDSGRTGQAGGTGAAQGP